MFKGLKVFTFLASRGCAHWLPLMGPGSRQSGEHLPGFAASIHVALRGKKDCLYSKHVLGLREAGERGRRDGEKLMCV